MKVLLMPLSPWMAPPLKDMWWSATGAKNLLTWPKMSSRWSTVSGDNGIKCMAIRNSMVSTWPMAGKYHPMECTAKHGISKDLVSNNHSPLPGWEVLGRNPLRLSPVQWWTRLTSAWPDTRHSDLTFPLHNSRFLLLYILLSQGENLKTPYPYRHMDPKQETLYCKDANLE